MDSEKSPPVEVGTTPKEGTESASTPPTTSRRPLSRRRRILFRCLLVVLVLAAIELISWLAITVVNPQLEEKIRRTSDIYQEQTELIGQLLDPDLHQLHEIHPVLGWRYAANHRSAAHQLNSAALRSTKDYSPRPGPGVLRIAAFGDSFVYGSEVENQDAWAALIEKDNPDLEVLNYGVPGYGTDQAYLRYRLEGATFAPQVVLIGFPPTDLWRVVNVYRRFYSNAEVPLFKPRFELDAQGELSLVDCPLRERADYQRLLTNPQEVRRYGNKDQWYQPLVYGNPLYDYSAAVRLLSASAVRFQKRYGSDRLIRDGVFDQNSMAFKIQCKLFEKFVADVRAAGATPLIVMFPDERAVHATRAGQPKLYDSLSEHLQKQGIACVDAADAFRDAEATSSPGEWFASGGHYSPTGNQIVASWLTCEIRKRFADVRRPK